MRLTFSQRMKLAPVRDAIQVEALDKETRNALWNLISPFLKTAMVSYPATILIDIWTDLYHEASDTCPNTYRPQEYNVGKNELFYRFFRGKIIDAQWHECLSFIEFIAEKGNRAKWNARIAGAFGTPQSTMAPLPKDYNAIFEQYMVGYRFVGDLIAPIIDKTEIQAIETAISEGDAAVSEQLSKALHFLSDRQNPDYAKSIACSISAVESQCNILLGGAKLPLGQALKELDKQGAKWHPALKEAFEKLYGFASNAPGIRHGGAAPSNANQTLAIFMLVACSAFINYLKCQKVK